MFYQEIMRNWESALSRIEAKNHPYFRKIDVYDNQVISDYYRRLSRNCVELRYDRFWGTVVMMARGRTYYYASDKLVFVMDCVNNPYCLSRLGCPDNCPVMPIRISPVWINGSGFQELYTVLDTIKSNSIGNRVIIESCDRQLSGRLHNLGFSLAQNWYPEVSYDVTALVDGLLPRKLRLGVNRFLNLGLTHSVKSLSIIKGPRILDVLTAWRTAYEGKRGYPASGLMTRYVNVVKYLLGDLKEHRLQGVAVFEGDHILSMSIGEKVSNSLGLFLLAVSSYDIPGLAEFTFLETLKDANRQGIQNATYGFSPSETIYRFKEKLGPSQLRRWVAFVSPTPRPQPSSTRVGEESPEVRSFQVDLEGAQNV